ncbi:Coq4 family protein [Gloeobacter morelensis]|uniref:Pyrroloquinoline quinone biosynthesis protein n=1 Tax=Gloeobacter morelensis MG652769 TaxID=2781736 RepID=A0ABY3PPH3_9CYAN|nr:Coq4 family protein [Gloeobacter morelensis]UFP95581.1 pyrroloquinoline quinone biosynthesis protein [Gloeobacter morelensis MG652769]
MGYRYINSLATPDSVHKFLELADLAAGSGQDVHNVFELSRKLRAGIQMQLSVQALQQDPASAKMLEEKYVGPPYDIEAMLKMPKGSLGWTYARVMSALGYDPQFYPPAPPSFETDGDYINFRVFKTHDIHHIITGYILDALGELGVISVSVGQFRYPTFLFLDLTALLLSFFTSDKLIEPGMDPRELNQTLGHKFRLISDGIEMGRAAKPLFPIKWEEGLDRPIEQWRQELNIKPVTDGPWSLYADSRLGNALEM